MEFDLNNIRFKSISNSENGEINSETTFHYRQNAAVVWATYEGGDVLFGTLSGSIQGASLFFHYQHQNINGDFKTGKCSSSVVLVDEKIRLQEQWQWTCDDFSKGESVLEEI